MSGPNYWPTTAIAIWLCGGAYGFYSADEADFACHTGQLNFWNRVELALTHEWSEEEGKHFLHFLHPLKNLWEEEPKERLDKIAVIVYSIILSPLLGHDIRYGQLLDVCPDLPFSGFSHSPCPRNVKARLDGSCPEKASDGETLPSR